MSEKLLLILCGAFDIAFVLWILRGRKRRKYHSCDLKYGRKYSGVHDLEAITNRLEALEQSIIQIELAKVHRMKGVTVQIPDALSQQHESTIIIDGRNNSSRFLLETLNAEKLQLREELDKKLERLYRTGSTETLTGECIASLASFPALGVGGNSRSIISRTGSQTVSKTKGAEL